MHYYGVMNMNMNRIDNVHAYAVETGDNIEIFTEGEDGEEGTYALHTVTKVEDDGTDVLIYTEEMDDPEVPFSFDAFDEVSLFGYTDEEE